MMSRIPLFPYRFKLYSIFLLIPGGIFFYLYYLGSKPDFFTSRIYAFITAYAETRYFTEAQTNLLDELAAILIIGGIAFLVFSKERNENAETGKLRLRAFFYSAYFTIIVWILVFIFIYGWVIFIFSSFIFPFFLLSYLAVFRFLLYRYNHIIKNHNF